MGKKKSKKNTRSTGQSAGSRVQKSAANSTTAGQQYLRKLGFPRLSSGIACHRELVRRFGQERVERFYQESPEGRDLRTFYDYKNTDIEFGRALSGLQDGDVLCRCVNWIHAHHEAFGQEILEIGIDAGLMTAFLGLEFPESHITAIDFSEKSVLAAQDLVNSFGLTNVTLLHMSLQDYAKAHPGEADTIVSVRALEENYDKNVPDLRLQPIDLQIRDMMIPSGEPYASLVIRALRRGGTIVSASVFRRGIINFSAAWMANLICKGQVIDYASVSRSDVCAPDPDESLTLFFSRDGRETEAMQDGQNENPGQDSSAEHPTREAADAAMWEVLSFWAGRRHLAIRPQKGYETVDADLLCALHRGELVKGVGLYTRQNILFTRLSLYTLRDFPNLLLIYSVMPNSDIGATVLQASKKEDYLLLLEQIHDGKNPNLAPLIQINRLRPCWLQVDEATGKEVPAKGENSLAARLRSRLPRRR